MSHLTSDLLIDFVHGELPPAQDASVHAHLAGCTSCRAAYEAEIGLTEALRAAALAEERELPPHLKAAVWEAVRTAAPSPLERLTAWWRPAMALPVAAVLALGAFFASPLAPHGAGPTVDAAYYLQAHAAQANRAPFSEPAGSQTLETSMLEGSQTVPATLAESLDGGFAAADGAVDAVR